MAFSPEDTQFTTTWWERLLSDEEKMNLWLVKLHRTEFSGYRDNIEAADRYCRENSAEYHIFKVTGEDEMRHAEILEKVLLGRGIRWSSTYDPPPSLYWDKMYEHVTDLKTVAAVFHLGEELAADRFRVILDHPETPLDIRDFLLQALPDEAYHARTFGRIAGEEMIQQFRAIHVETVSLLKRGRA